MCGIVTTRKFGIENNEVYLVPTSYKKATGVTFAVFATKSRRFSTVIDIY